MFELDFAARVDPGLVRDTNQDVARVVPRLGLALVADGMGGHDHGGIASQVAADGLEEGFGGLGGPGANLDETAERLLSAFGEANRRLAGHPASAGGPGRMGTTLVAAVFAHGRAILGNIGDSRCYRWRLGKLELLTQDHSYAAELRQTGQAASPAGRLAAAELAHVLTRCLNGEQDVSADIRIVRCEPGDVYLLCSDGLWGSASDGVVGGILAAERDPKEACERLVGAAWAGGGSDNIGVAVVRLRPMHLSLHEPPRLEERDRRSDQPPAGEASS